MNWFSRKPKTPPHQHDYEILKEVPRYLPSTSRWSGEVGRSTLLSKHSESWNVCIYFKCKSCGHVKFDEIEDVDKSYIDSLNNKPAA